MKTQIEIEQCAERLLRSPKKKIIAANFETFGELTGEQLKHFRNAEYIWNLEPQIIDGPYKNKFMGLLLDETLEYVHIVFASQECLDFIFKTKHGNH